MTLLRKVFRRSPADLFLAFRVAGLLLLVRIALVLLPYRVVEARLRPDAASADQPRDARRGRRTIWAVDTTAKRLLGSRPCLTQALVARWLLAKSGYLTVLRIGVQKEQNRTDLRAHAWLEHEGLVVVGGHASRQEYRVLDPIPRVRAEVRGMQNQAV